MKAHQRRNATRWLLVASPIVLVLLAFLIFEQPLASAPQNIPNPQPPVLIFLNEETNEQTQNQETEQPVPELLIPDEETMQNNATNNISQSNQTNQSTLTNQTNQTNATALPPSERFNLRVNVGGSTFIDSKGNIWNEDYGFSSSQVFSTASLISGTDDQQLYRSERWSDAPSFTYDFPMPNGTYNVTLHFAEIYSPLFVEGARVFSVKAEEEYVIEDIDIYAQAGSNYALKLTFQTEINDGELSLEFLRGPAENPKVSAIEAVRVQ